MTNAEEEVVIKLLNKKFEEVKQEFVDRLSKELEPTMNAFFKGDFDGLPVEWTEED